VAVKIQTLVVLAFAAALACSRPTLNLGEGCQINSDCADPLGCVFGSCRRQCVVSGDCGVGLRCLVTSDTLGGGCQLPDEMSCTLTSECDPRLVCQYGTCTTACNDSRDCARGAQCMENAGVSACYDTAVESCIYNSDCDAPMICDAEQRCRLECAADRDCIAPRVCAANLCVLPDTGVGGDGGT
jgi:hypothetical protein